MQNVILVVHILTCLAMIVLVLMQKSEGGGLGIGGGGGNSLMSGRGAAGTIVRTTILFGGIFFVTSLTLTAIANRTAEGRSGLERALETQAPEAIPGPVDLLDPTVPLFRDEPRPAAPPAESPVEPPEPESASSGEGDPQ
jgi:preprotein translocase subunit SecG